MSVFIQAAIAISAGGLFLTLSEMLLPRSKSRIAAKAAIGILFLELLAGKIADIFL